MFYYKAVRASMMGPSVTKLIEKGIAMKLIAWTDKGNPARPVLVGPMDLSLKRQTRIAGALDDLRGLGNCNIYYVKGNKCRLIAERGMS
jgi:hypothetical protein